MKIDRHGLRVSGRFLFTSLAVALTFGGLTQVDAWAEDAPLAAEPLPAIGQKDRADSGAGWINQSDMNLVRRAQALGQWQGDVSLGGNSGSPGVTAFSPGVTARLGLGYGLTLELTATGRTNDWNSFRPGAGVKWQALGGAGKNYGLAVMALLRPEGFTEIEGEVEFHVIGHYRVGRNELGLNLTAGGDPDGKDRDIEGHVGYGYRVNDNLVVGVEEQSRAGLGTKVEFMGRQEHVAGPSVQYRVGKLLLSGLVGGGANQLAWGDSLKIGAWGMGRIAYHF